MADNRLGVHVIGPRYGESVVLELPDGSVGVIDSYASHQRGRHPVVEFLRRRFPRLTGLRFFALTHPHADHCFRAAEVMDEFPPGEVWAFRPFPSSSVQDYYVALERCGKADDVEKALGLPAGSVAISLLQFEERVVGPVKARTLRFRYLSAGRAFPVCDERVKIHFLTPGDHQQVRYGSQIGAALKKALGHDPARGPLRRLPTVQHNLTSGGVLIEYGKSRALLMADAERPLWDEWYQSGPSTAPWKPVHFLKTAHHGSGNGYHARLYSELADPALTVAVVTPFNHGRVHLPVAAGVQSLRPHVHRVYCTNRTSAAESTGLDWVAVTVRPLPAVPGHWTRQITGRPALAGLFVPGAGLVARAGGRVPAVPGEWIENAHADGALWFLLRPEHRRPVPGLVAAEDYRVSARLDDAGDVAVDVGYEAGLLAP